MGMNGRAGYHVYRSRRWTALRQAAKRRDGFKCVQCGASGRLEIDHVRSVREAPELAFDLTNLQSLCPTCHGRKTAIEKGIAPLDPQRQEWRDLLKPKRTPACLNP